MLVSDLYDDFYEYDDEYEQYGYEDEDEEDIDYEDGGLSKTLKAKYDIFSSKLETKISTIEFSYGESTPLQYVLDELSDYVEDNKLDFASIFSMHTDIDDDGNNILTVAFNL